MSATIEEYRSRLREALNTINQMKARLESLARARTEPIAVLGMACRFPGGARTPEDFFRLLEEGRDAITEVPKQRWRLGPVGDDPATRGVRWGAFIDQVDRFDAGFFGIAPREAARLDPQQRLLLELAWEALERAGQVPPSLAGSRTGVFLGLMTNDYALIDAAAGGAQQDAYSATGNGHCFPAGRLSYTFGFQGPSLVVDTACSSSLVAVHLACQSLRARECDLALVGGVNLMLAPEVMELFSKTRALSPDGRCKTFDAAANGYVRGEGGGMVVLKRLSDALRDGDPIVALIRGSAVNQDGRSTGLTTPNVLAQEALVRAALENAGVAAADIGYVETHGTGTPLGDPIEVEALRAVLGEPRADGSPCVLGAVKTNIGHLEAAAGVAGLIKVIMALGRGSIPKNLHYRALNPRIDLEGTPFVIAAEHQPWKRSDKPRRAGVSAFGLSGTNAHVIVEEAPEEARKAGEEDTRAALLPLSAKSPEALWALAIAYAELLGSAGDASLADIARTASVRRAHLSHRLAAVGRTRRELADALLAWAQGGTPENVSHGQTSPQGRPRVVFVFPGQGSQWARMGQELLAQEPVFRAALEACDEAIRREAGFSVLEELAADEGRARLDEVAVVQPLLFAMAVALAELFRSWGVTPDCVVGHSMGEVAAAHVAGILSLDDAVKIICRRSKLLGRVSGKGAMGLVELGAAEAAQAVAGYEDRLGIAACNGPRATVLSGDPAALEEVLSGLEKRGVFCRRVKVEVASHSPQVDVLRGDLLAALRDIRPTAGHLAMRSTVLEKQVTGPELDAAYWVKNLRDPVRFSQVTQGLVQEGHDVFVEISPHPILLPSLGEHLREAGRRGATIAALRRQADERGSMLEALVALHVRGYPVDLARLFPAGGPWVPLPTYPWQRQRFWTEAAQARARGREARRGGHPLLGPRLCTSTQRDTWFWQTELDLTELPYLGDHCLAGSIVLPGAAYIEAALAAARERLGAGPLVLEDLAFVRPLVLREDEPLTVEVALTREPEGWWTFQLSSLAGGAGEDDEPQWLLHASARVHVEREGDARVAIEPLAAVRERCRKPVPLDELEREQSRRGMTMGPAFQGLCEVWRDKHEAVGRVRLPAALQAEAHAYLVHPALLDAALRVELAADEAGVAGEMRVLARIARLRFAERSGREVWSHVRHGSPSSATIFDDTGRVLLEIEGIEQPSAGALALAHDAHAELLVAQTWEPAEALPAPRADGGAGRWLILADATGFGETLRGQLAERGGDVVCAWIRVAGPRGAQEPLVVDPAEPAEIAAMLREAFRDGARCRGIIHCWGFEGGETSDVTLASLEAAHVRGCGAALHLVQALARMGMRDMPRLWLVVQGTQAVEQAPRDVAVSQAPLWGLGRTIAVEYPELRCTRVDLDPEQPDAGALVREILSNSAEDEVALRGGQRFVARLTRPATVQAAGKGAAVLPDATYLITGGLGGLGLLAAQGLVAAGARHLALLGRQGLTTQAQAEVIAALEAAGARVLPLRADVADPEQLASALLEIDARLPPLRGVIHTAGVLDDGLLENQTLARFRRVLAPKVLGAWNLHRQTAERELDFFVMYSSLTALLGSPGIGNYVAANTFLDALAHHRCALGLAATSIDWGLFAGVGMAVKADEGGRISQQGMEGLAPAEGSALLLRALREGWTQMGVGAMNLRRWLEHHPQLAASPRLAPLARIAPHALRGGARARDEALLASLAQAPPGGHAPILEELLRHKLGEILRLDPGRIDRTSPLRELGIDSLMSLELRNRLEATLGITLSATLVWTYPTIAALAEHLREALQLEAPPDPEEASAPAPAPSRELEELSGDALLALLDEELALTRKER